MKTSDADNHGNPPVRLGITGGVSSGKTVVCDYLRRKGVTVVSTDQLAKDAVKPGMPAYDKIVKYFGTKIVSGDGALDRKKLRKLITEDHIKKKMLEEFVHPEVFVQMAEAYAAAQKRQEPLFAVEVPLLFEMGMASLFDYILTVTVDADVRVQRLMDRDHVTRDEALALMGIQMPEEEKILRSDFVIENNGSLEDTRLRMDAFYNQLISLIKRNQADKID
ncbi:MAG: dephospho-CoA kinase [Desulfobacteraceae bacterium]|nr:MAG: dephospho-CoA kinase [Desulfobacteraceae bacterium]